MCISGKLRLDLGLLYRMCVFHADPNNRRGLGSRIPSW